MCAAFTSSTQGVHLAGCPHVEQRDVHRTTAITPPPPPPPPPSGLDAWTARPAPRLADSREACTGAPARDWRDRIAQARGSA